MRKGKVDPMMIVVAGAVLGGALMFTCFRTVTKNLGPSMELSAAAAGHFRKSVNITDRDGVVMVMITDTTAFVADTVTAPDFASPMFAMDVAKWILENRRDTTAIKRMALNTFRTAKGSMMPKMVHSVTLRPAQLDSLRESIQRNPSARGSSAPDSAGRDTASTQR